MYHNGSSLDTFSMMDNNVVILFITIIALFFCVYFLCFRKVIWQISNVVCVVKHLQHNAVELAT